MQAITEARRSQIKFECRSLYRSTGTTESPYPSGTIENIAWEHEALQIMIEEMESV